MIYCHTQYSIAQFLQKLAASWVKIVKDADPSICIEKRRIERNKVLKKLISIDVVMWLDDSDVEDLILVLIDRFDEEEKKRKFFFSRFLSSLFFRSDWIRTKKKRKSHLAHSSTTINKSRKKEEIEEKKERKKISSLTRRISLPQRRRREEEKNRPNVHTYKLSPLSITTIQLNK